MLALNRVFNMFLSNRHRNWNRQCTSHRVGVMCVLERTALGVPELVVGNPWGMPCGSRGHAKLFKTGILHVKHVGVRAGVNSKGI